MARLAVTETFGNIAFPGHMHTQDSLNYAVNFEFQDTDIVIVTYPKSGTTWMQEIITIVLNHGDATLARSQPNWARAPWLEQYYCPTILTSFTGTRIITTHLPYQLLGPALQHSKAKIIYVARNLKDVSVSYYHFHNMAKFLPEPGSFSEFLCAFLEGKVHYGSWFDHVKGWTSHAKEIQKILFITYEEMLQDLKASLKNVSEFLKCRLSEEELINAQKHCSFSYMKENTMVNYTLVPLEIMDHNRGQFMRKGQVGDWKNLFTKEQSQLVDKVYSLEMTDHSLLLRWEDSEDTSEDINGFWKTINNQILPQPDTVLLTDANSC